MKAVILAVGSELVEGITRDTNSIYIASRLMEMGYMIVKKAELDDDEDLIASEIRASLNSADVIVVTGGLGPTRDDLTREAVAKALGTDLRFDEKLYEKIERKLKSHLVDIPESIKKEAMVLEGAEILENDVGSAPGQLLNLNDRYLVLLPGPPPEMKNVFEKFLKILTPKERLITKILKFYGIRESVLENDLKDVVYSVKGIKVATQADFIRGVMIRFVTNESNLERLNDILKVIRSRYSRYIYAEDDETMEDRVVKLLLDRGLTLATAESCTGGMLASTVVNVPGASRVFKGGIIAYDNAVKLNLLKVKEKTLKTFGAVSGECVEEMSEGVAKLFESDLSVSVSGIAGPSGGSGEKPVGTVFIDVYNGSKHWTEKYKFGYDRSRNTIRKKSVMTALDMLRRTLLDWRDAG